MRVISERRVGTTNTTTPVYIESDPVPAGEFWVLDFASLYNQSGESVTLQWVIRRGGQDIFVSADLTVADGDAYPSVDLPILAEGEIFAARVTGSAKASTVTMVLCAVPASVVLPALKNLVVVEEATP
jgi:hypothetical protein